MQEELQVCAALTTASFSSATPQSLVSPTKSLNVSAIGTPSLGRSLTHLPITPQLAVLDGSDDGTVAFDEAAEAVPYREVSDRVLDDTPVAILEDEDHLGCVLKVIRRGSPSGSRRSSMHTSLDDTAPLAPRMSAAEVAMWSARDVWHWLHSKAMPHLADTFLANSISGADLADLCDDDLRSMRILDEGLREFVLDTLAQCFDLEA